MADDLTETRDRLAEALTREHYHRANERIAASVEQHCAAFADAAMVVVGPDLAERDALKAATDRVRAQLNELDSGTVLAVDLKLLDPSDLDVVRHVTGRVRAALDHPTDTTGETETDRG